MHNNQTLVAHICVILLDVIVMPQLGEVGEIDAVLEPVLAVVFE